MADFQPSVPLDLFGHMHATLIHETGTSPSTIINAGTPFQVHVEWAIDGSVVPLMAGNYNVRVFFEGFGTKSEKDYAAPPEPVVPIANHHYAVHIPVAGGDLEEGAYKLIALITYTNAAGNPGPIAGYSDEVVIQIAPLT